MNDDPKISFTVPHEAHSAWWSSSQVSAASPVRWWTVEESEEYEESGIPCRFVVFDWSGEVMKTDFVCSWKYLNIKSFFFVQTHYDTNPNKSYNEYYCQMVFQLRYTPICSTSKIIRQKNRVWFGLLTDTYTVVTCIHKRTNKTFHFRFHFYLQKMYPTFYKSSWI